MQRKLVASLRKIFLLHATPIWVLFPILSSAEETLANVDRLVFALLWPITLITAEGLEL